MVYSVALHLANVWQQQASFQQAPLLTVIKGVQAVNGTKAR